MEIFFGIVEKVVGNKRKMLVASDFPFSHYGFQSLSEGLNPFPNKPWFLHVWSTSILKTLWEKKKLLVTSNFSVSYSVFYPVGELSANGIKIRIVICKVFQFWKLLTFVWERVNPFPNMSLFLRVCHTSLLKTLWAKGEIDHNEQFPLFPQCFQPSLENSSPFS